MTKSFVLKLKRQNKHILRYYKLILKKAKKEKKLSNTEKWFFDNYLNINGSLSSLISNLLKREIIKVKYQTKKELFSFTKEYLEKNNYDINIEAFYKEFNEYQSVNRNFSYHEIEFLFYTLEISLFEKLSNISNTFKSKLNCQNYINKRKFNINNIKKIIKKYNKTELNKYAIYLLNFKIKNNQNFNTFYSQFIDLISEYDLKNIIAEIQKKEASDNILTSSIFTMIEKVSYQKIEDFYKATSMSERLLLNEKVEIYPLVHEEDKYYYRKEITKISKKKKINEFNLVKDLVAKADLNNHHIGFEIFKQPKYNFRTHLYLLSILVLSILVSITFTFETNIYLYVPILVLSISIVMDLINQFLRIKQTKNHIFRLDYKNGISKENRTMVVVPTIIKTNEKIDKIFNNLEIFYLSSRTKNLYFTLLGDCSSEKTKQTDFDETLYNHGIEVVNRLNEKYNSQIFNFVYRNRFYSKTEETYLGFERKRGALKHFNKLLLNKLTDEEIESYFYGETISKLKTDFKYVITLDCDTELLLSSAKKLVGLMAHPLNRPVLSLNKDKVISGYGIMQPLIGYDTKVTDKSEYTQIYTGFGGLDPYITGNFDVYHDVFGEGCFTGKGIYDLEIFDQILSASLPDNLILSHDLLEGNYIRCAFVNSVELFDDFPSNYFADSKRRHRWNRGDWQIIGWLKRKVKTNTDKVNNPLNLLSKIKIASNLLRSLLPLSQMSIILYGLIISNSPYIYILIALLPIFLNLIYYIISNLKVNLNSNLFVRYYKKMIKGFSALIVRSAISFMMLPYETWLYLDSTIRAIYRMTISKKKLLAWITAEDMENKISNNFVSNVLNLKPNIIVSVLLITYSLITNHNINSSITISLVWILNIFVVYIMNKPIVKKESKLDIKDTDELLELAKKTLDYFKDNLKEEYNYLIPDNCQPNRDKVLDIKTSPTNIGLSLVSIISAYHLNQLTFNEAIEILLNIIKTVEKLNKWHGHLFNWYNIKDLEIMYPKIVSTVDSGNFVTSLFVVRAFAKDKSNDLYYRVNKLIEDTDFKALFIKEKNLFSEGYDFDKQKHLKNDFNSLMSEARLTSYIAIAKQEISYKHWFKLYKPIVKYKNNRGVASWHGSLFEYYMPLIFMKRYPHTLLDESYHFALKAHKKYIEEINSDLPFGISEAASSELDEANYRYQTYGISNIALSNNKYDRIVVSPYSSIMGIELDPKEICSNISKFKQLDMIGKYGLYDSYDYKDKSVVPIYYAHHQGMILASITNYLCKDIIKEYFHSSKSIKAIEPLLKDKIDLLVPCKKIVIKNKVKNNLPKEETVPIRRYNIKAKRLEYGILSNGNFTTVINNKGYGFSKYKEIYINRYLNNSVNKAGSFLYIKNLNNNYTWSNIELNQESKPKFYDVIFSNDVISFMREDRKIITKTEIIVPQDEFSEIRKVTFNNMSNEDVTLELTTYSDIILSRKEDDIAHPNFNTLNILSEFEEETESLIFSKRLRSENNNKFFAIHNLISDSDVLEYETNKTSWIGRNNYSNRVEIVKKGLKLTNNVGTMLEPIMSIRKRVTIPKDKSKTVYIILGFGKSKEQVKEIVNKYKEESYIERLFYLSNAFNTIAFKYSDLNKDQINSYNNLLPYVFNYTKSPNKNKLLIKNNLDKSYIWRYGISGNLPLLTLNITKADDIPFIDSVIGLFEYYKSNQIGIDIIIINNMSKDKAKDLEDYINSSIFKMNNTKDIYNVQGRIVTILGKLIDSNYIEFLKTLSLFYIDDNYDSFFNFTYDFIQRNELDNIKNSQIIKTEENKIKPNLLLDNGYGGYKEDNSYYIYNNNTKAPWSNIIANDRFGTIITNNFGGYSYALNSREYKITEWNPDLTNDSISEKICIDGKQIIANEVNHNFGYTDLYTYTNNYDLKTTIFVNEKLPIKYYYLDFKNKLQNKITLNISLSLKMVLGYDIEFDSKFIEYELDSNRNTIYFKNKYTKQFAKNIIYLTSTEKIISYSLDSLLKTITVSLELSDNYKMAFMLGLKETDVNSQSIKEIDNELLKVINKWNNKLSVFKIKTKEPYLNYAFNGWLLYQVYSSRLYAKAGFYQTGGAFGFRDQLQDILSIIYIEPEFAKNHILECAKHQFKEGDVLHWWHEDIMLGSRTTFSDDYLWLIYVVSEYIKITEDYDILNIEVDYIKGDKLKDNEKEKGVVYEYIKEPEPLYMHIIKMYDKALNQFGTHGLSLMGIGDWNDGMSTVGYKGEGESIFVSLFLHYLINIIDIFKDYINTDYVSKYKKENKILKENIINNTWDGKWFIRAYFDNLETLGSRNNEECQIDLLSQSWSILTDIASDEQKESIFKEVDKRLVNKDLRIIKLLMPSFQDSTNNPGYIMAYPVGIRENGAQYTHATMWYIKTLLKENKIEEAHNYLKMISSIDRSLTKEQVDTYKVEPYVVPADIYSNPSQKGRGGWTWYTGAANWYYKIVLEDIIGFKKRGNKLTLNPKIPADWESFELEYQYMETKYIFKITNNTGLNTMLENNIPIKELTLVNDLTTHIIDVKI